MNRVEIPFARIAEARSKSGPLHERRTAEWARRLASERALFPHAVRDLFTAAIGFVPFTEKSVTQLTGAPAATMFHHPGRKAEAMGTLCCSAGSVAHALIVLHRLGVPVPAAEMTEALREKLSRKRDNPLLDEHELAVLWHPRRLRVIHAVAYNGDAPDACYSLALPDGRVLVGGTNPNGDRIEVIGPTGGKGLHGEFLDAGGRLPWPEFNRLVKNREAA